MDNSVLQKDCSRCKQSLPATSDYFSRNKTRKDGLQPVCKPCVSAYKKAYYLANKERISTKSKVYREAHKEQAAERSQRFAATHREHLRSYHQQYYEKHRESFIEKGKEQYKQHREHILACAARYRQLHRSHIREYHRMRTLLKREEIAEKRKQRYHANPEHFRAQKRHDYQKHKESRQLEIRQYRKTAHGRAMKRAAWHRRELLKRAIGGSLTTKQIEQKLKAQHYRCYYAACGHARFEKHEGRYIYHIEHTIPVSRTEHSPRHDVNYVVLACPTCNLQKGTKLPHEWGNGGRLF